MELDAWLALNETSEETRKAYEYFMRPEPKDIRSEIMTEEGTGLRYRIMAVGMTRNASEENKNERKVYLDPIPHIRIRDAKALQGWYKSKVEKAGVRDRPCFTDAMLTEPYGGYCAVGCAFSLVAGELIDTPDGPRAIESLRVGDLVYGRTREGRVAVPVEATTNHWKAEGYVVVELEDGRELKDTADHPVYSASRGWVAMGDLLPGEVLEDLNESEALSGLPHAYSVRAEGLRQLFARRAFTERSEEQDHTPHTPVSGLPYRDSQPSPFVRFLRASGAFSQRIGEQGQAFFSEGASEVSGDAAEDERARSTEPGRHGGQGFWAEVSGVQSAGSRARSCWEAGVQAVEAFLLHGSAGARFPYAFAMGGLDGYVAGQSGLHLGVRAGGAQSAQRNGVPAGLSALRREMAGGKGLLLGRGSSSNRGSQSAGASDTAAGRKDAASARCVRVRSVPGGLTVYDIQTSTRNFYQRGVLVHNCYINSGVRGYRGSGLISVPMNYGEQLATQLKKAKTSAAGYFSSFTDPFLPLEEVYHNTQQGIRAFTNLGLPVFILSRKQYPKWAMDALMLNPHSYAQKSINTWNESVWKRLSPGAASLATHMEDIRELRERGVYVSIQVNPILPGIVNHEDVVKTFEMLAEAGANHVIIKFVEASYSWAPAMEERVHQRFKDVNPEGAARFADLFTQNIGGQRTIQEEYRMEGHHIYRAAATEMGMTYAVCYEYKYERDMLGNVKNKTGVSVGREFLTAEQCHGHKVPMYSRLEFGQRFKPVEECAPTGCLHCADDNAGKPRCGSNLFGAAKALRTSDFKKSVWEETEAPDDPRGQSKVENLLGDMLGD